MFRYIHIYMCVCVYLYIYTHVYIYIYLNTYHIYSRGIPNPLDPDCHVQLNRAILGVVVTEGLAELRSVFIPSRNQCLHVCMDVVCNGTEWNVRMCIKYIYVCVCIMHIDR